MSLFTHRSDPLEREIARVRQERERARLELEALKKKLAEANNQKAPRTSEVETNLVDIILPPLEDEDVELKPLRVTQDRLRLIFILLVTAIVIISSIILWLVSRALGMWT